MKEMEGGCVCVEEEGGEKGGNWDMKERGRENKSPSEEDDASWLEKQQEILSLPSCLPALIFVFLSSLFFCLYGVVVHTRVDVVIFWIAVSNMHAHQPWSARRSH